MNNQVKSKIFHYDFLKKNRRGFLLAEETLKIIIAVIAIGFLIYFLTSLYLKNQESKDLEFAKASLENLISSVDLGEVLIYNPEDWVIVSWPHEVMKGIYGFRNSVMDMPNFCENLDWNNCLCICKDTVTLNLEGSDCDSGYCVESSILVNEERNLKSGDIGHNQIKIESPPIKLLIKDGKITK